MASQADMADFLKMVQLQVQTELGQLGSLDIIDTEWAGAEGFNPDLNHTPKLNQAAIDAIFGANVFTEDEIQNVVAALAADRSAILANIPQMRRLARITISG